jgi:hypothetical protein
METVAHYILVSNIYEAERNFARGGRSARHESGETTWLPEVTSRSRRDPYNGGNKPDSFIGA